VCETKSVAIAQKRDVLIPVLMQPDKKLKHANTPSTQGCSEQLQKLEAVVPKSLQLQRGDAPQSAQTNR
jgi:hypothetical protein